jgi:hypothetical protein
MVSITPLWLYPREIMPVPIQKEAGWAQEPVLPQLCKRIVVYMELSVAQTERKYEES